MERKCNIYSKKISVEQMLLVLQHHLIQFNMYLFAFSLLQKGKSFTYILELPCSNLVLATHKLTLRDGVCNENNFMF